MRFFSKVGKAWGGVIVGAATGATGVIITSLWGKYTIEEKTINTLNTFVNANVTIASMTAEIDISSLKDVLIGAFKTIDDIDESTMAKLISIVEYFLTQPIPITIKNISFAVSQMLNPSMLDIIKNGPAVLGDVAGGTLGGLSSILFLAALSAAIAGVYAYKRSYSVHKEVVNEHSLVQRLLEGKKGDIEAAYAGTGLDNDGNPIIGATVINIAPDPDESQDRHERFSPR